MDKWEAGILPPKMHLFWFFPTKTSFLFPQDTRDIITLLQVSIFFNFQFNSGFNPLNYQKIIKQRFKWESVFLGSNSHSLSIFIWFFFLNSLFYQLKKNKCTDSSCAKILGMQWWRGTWIRYVQIPFFSCFQTIYYATLLIQVQQHIRILQSKLQWLVKQ